MEYLLSKSISISSGMNIFAAVNPFYQSCAETMLGNYLNVNMLGYPVGQMAAGIMSVLVFCAAFFIIGMQVFSDSFQIEGESLYEKLMRRFRRRLSAFWHTDRIAVFETVKILFHQKRVIALLLFMLIIVGFSRHAFTRPLTELEFFMVIPALRLALYMAFTVFVLNLTSWFKSQAAVGVLGILTVVMTAMICRLLNTDIVVIVLSML